MDKIKNDLKFNLNLYDKNKFYLLLLAIFTCAFGLFYYIFENFTNLSQYKVELSKGYFIILAMSITFLMILFFRYSALLRRIDYYYFFLSYLILSIIIVTLFMREQTYMGFRIFYDNMIKYVEIIILFWGLFIVGEKSESKKFNIIFILILVSNLMYIIFLPQEQIEKFMTITLYLELLYVSVITVFNMKKVIVNVILFKITAEIFLLLFYMFDKTTFLLYYYIIFLFSYIVFIHYLNYGLDKVYLRQITRDSKKIKKILDFSENGILVLENFFIYKANKKALVLLNSKINKKIIGKSIFSIIERLRKEDIIRAIEKYPEPIYIQYNFNKNKIKLEIICNEIEVENEKYILLSMKSNNGIKENRVFENDNFSNLYVFYYERDLGYKFINKSLREFFGYSIKELNDREELLRNIKFYENSEEIENIFLDKKDIINREITIENSKKESVVLLVNGRNIIIENENLYYFIGVDITKEKAEKQKIYEENKRFKNENKKRDMDMSILSHEIRTPITAVIGLTENILINKQEMSESAFEMLEKVFKNSMRLKELIENLLDYNKMNAEKMDTYFEEVNLYRVINEIVLNNTTLIEMKKISTVLNLDKNLHVLADEGMCFQILNNILSNAIKYNNENGIIEFSNEKTDREIIIKIRDTGIGINDENKDKIFNAYERVKGVKEKGTGLGLALSKQMIEKNNGKIYFESEYGKGTTFYIHFSNKIIN